MWDLRFQTRDWTHAPCSGSSESWLGELSSRIKKKKKVVAIIVFVIHAVYQDACSTLNSLSSLVSWFRHPYPVKLLLGPAKETKQNNKEHYNKYSLLRSAWSHYWTASLQFLGLFFPTRKSSFILLSYKLSSLEILLKTHDIFYDPAALQCLPSWKLFYVV